ncbi:MAG TPA: hypothetical protein PLW14_00780 [Chlorobiota bacterium]|nr:hypothetical protein [Chlorobiota bacterium]
MSALLVTSCATALAQRRPLRGGDGEIIVGPLLTRASDTLTGTLGVGVAMTWPIVRADVNIGVHIMPTFGFSYRDGSPDISTVQVPFGLMFRVQDKHIDGEREGIGGGIFVGVAISARLRYESDIRPAVGMDISLGVFRHGSLRLRYMTFIDPSRSTSITDHHGLFLVGSTSF